MQKKNDTKTTAQPTEAEYIWEEIKDKPIDMFGLPNQIVSQYCVPTTVEPSKLYLLAKASAVLPSLEVALGKNYTVEALYKYLVVSRTISKF